MKKMLLVLLVSFSAQSFGVETIGLNSKKEDEVAGLVGANQSQFSRFCKRMYICLTEGETKAWGCISVR